jgi:uncharacterized damage-inducible protein DinB
MDEKEAAMSHPLVEQLRFTRSEWQRALEGVTEEDAGRRIEPMNSISWMAGHLAWHEQSYWLKVAQGSIPFPDLDETVATGKPASSPSFAEMQAAWRAITTEADSFLDTLTTQALADYLQYKGRTLHQNTGTLLQRLIYHYWFHTGECIAVRQILGHTDLPEFVGYIHALAPYRPEPLP